MNVLSAAAGSSGGGDPLLRRPGARLRARRSALATSLALGFGHAFWSKALYAKGYTLNAALVAAGFLFLLTWGQSRQRRHLYAAIAIFALSSGNHLIVIALLPALLLFVIATDPQDRAGAAHHPRHRRTGRSPGCRSTCSSSIRTRQNAPYLEARAANFRELLDVMLARRWAHEIGAYQSSDLLSARVPLVTGLVTTELTIAGLVLAAIGLLVLGRQRPREAGLLFLSAAGIITLTANMSSNEDEGFLLPAFVALWLLAGCGLQWVFALAGRARSRFSTRSSGLVTTGTLIAVAALPASLLAGNFRTNDHHNRTFEIRYFDSLFEMLPDKSTLIEDRYILNMMVKYKLLGERAAGARHIDTAAPVYESVSEKMRQGYRIYTFDDGKVKLETLGYEFEPVQLYDVPLPAFLDVIGRNWTVAIAATPDVAAQLRGNRDGWAAARRLGQRDLRTEGRRAAGHCRRQRRGRTGARGSRSARSARLGCAERPDRQHRADGRGSRRGDSESERSGRHGERHRPGPRQPRRRAGADRSGWRDRGLPGRRRAESTGAVRHEDLPALPGDRGGRVPRRG